MIHFSSLLLLLHHVSRCFIRNSHPQPVAFCCFSSANAGFFFGQGANDPGSSCQRPLDDCIDDPQRNSRRCPRCETRWSWECGSQCGDQCGRSSIVNLSTMNMICIYMLYIYIYVYIICIYMYIYIYSTSILYIYGIYIYMIYI